ncbi:type II secretion system F family protein [Variovorax sp. VNK109]|jgi:tight adherence protein C|uniref:type II secretion system F family protein n=1 Tax=Variovorax sp. VNK109 TaxID=3400919 RepID=UPI003C0DE601
MGNTLIIFAIAMTFGLAVLCMVFALGRLKQQVPTEDRAYLDTLPPILRMAWPLVRFMEYHIGKFIPSSALEKTSKQLQLTGVSFLMGAEQFFALRFICMVVAFGFTWFALGALEKNSPGILIGITLLGFFYPSIWLGDVRKKRVVQVQKTLPTYLDYITMAVEAGLNMTGAINQAMEKGPQGPLKHEFYLVVRDLRAGVPRADALRRMEARMQMSEITSFVGTTIQAEKMGARLGTALRAQAEQRRSERFQRAEKQAMEAPVKLIFPLLVFIFPLTFLILGFPIAMKFLTSGIV